MSRSIVVVLLLFLFSNPSPCSSSFTFPYSNNHILLSVSHSLFSRVANLREARGDFHAADRARSIATILENGLDIGSSSFTFPYSKNHILPSLSHSLLSRVANLREARGDYHAADRARSIARILENGLVIGSFWNIMWSVAWDYDWRDAAASFDMSELNQLLRGLTEFSTVASDRERVDWINLLRVSTSLLATLRKVLRQSGPLKEVIETLQKEVLEGDLLKDCLELGTTDLKGLLMVFKDISSKHTSTSIFFKQGPLKEVIETLQKEVLKGDLLKDCLELGTTDLKGLLMVFKDISSKHTSTSSTGADL